MRIQKINGKCNICGERVREAREKALLSQELLGSPIMQKTISRIESGARVVPDYEIPLLANALCVSPLWLLGLD